MATRVVITSAAMMVVAAIGYTYRDRPMQATASAQAKVPPMTSQAPSGWLIRGTKPSELGLPENTYIPFPGESVRAPGRRPGAGGAHTPIS